MIQKTNNKELSAFFDDNVICLQVPGTMIVDLNNTDKIGFEGRQGDLFLLVEKDFTCLDNVAEDQSDNYPNPLTDHLKWARKQGSRQPKIRRSY